MSSIAYPGTATNTFTYNGLDTRVGKVDSSGTSAYKRDGADVMDPVLSDGSAAYTPGISEHRSSATPFGHADYLGTFTRQTSSSQVTTATRQYDAFGLLVASTGTPQGPFGFAGAQGYQEDADSGLKLLGHRYYDPSTGRFLTRDPVKDGRNWYSYCENAPTGAIDSDGHFVILVALAGAALIYIGVRVGVATWLRWKKLQIARDEARNVTQMYRDHPSAWPTDSEGHLYGPWTNYGGKLGGEGLRIIPKK